MTRLPSIAANRQIEPTKLSTLVRGELDWIVMKALEKDRTRRYETANGLAADIEHYLQRRAGASVPAVSGLPAAEVREAEQGAGGGGGLVLLALVGGIVGTTVGPGTRRPGSAGEAERAEGTPGQDEAEDEKPRRGPCSTSWRTKSSPPPGRKVWREAWAAR